MIDHGLFFDAAALGQSIPVRRLPGRTDLDGYAVEPVLSSCKSVAEAVSYLSHFNLMWQDRAQIFLADRTGDCAIIHGNWVVRNGSAKNFALTNHRLDVASPENCWRRNLALHELEAEPIHDINLVGRICAETAQTDLSNATLYSDAVDLTNGEVTIFNDRRYNHPVTLNLQSELKKGVRTVNQATLFPPDLMEVIKSTGLGHALELVRAGQFSSEEVTRAGNMLLLDGHLEDGVRLFRVAQGVFHTASSSSSLGNALNAAGRSREALACYRAALAQNPADYNANLMGRADGRVVFRLKGFTYANKVAVVGSFIQDPSGLSLTHEGDEWIGEAKLPKGKYYYALHIDDSWTTDPYNGLAALRGEYYSSVLFVH